MTLRLALLTLALLFGSSCAYAQDENLDGDPRGEERTLATFPEWYIVYSAEEYARFVAEGGMPSEFPYFDAIRQYWETLEILKANLGDATIDEESQTVLTVIGTSFTLEYGAIGIYEKTIGRLSEFSSLGKKTPIDRFTDAVAADYAQFLYQTPWYAFPYADVLGRLWREAGPHAFASARGFERMSAFSLGYGLKGLYGAIITYLTKSTFGYVGMETEVSFASGSTTETITLPRYRAFKEPFLTLLRSGAAIDSIQGNDRILVSAIAPRSNSCEGAPAPTFEMPILTRERESRFGYLIPVGETGTVVAALDACDISIEHVYDY